MSKYKKLGKNMLSLTIGSFGSKLLTFFFVPFYTAILTTEEYGVADLVTTTVSLIFPFFSFIICEALLRFAQEKNEAPEQIYAVGIFTWIGGLILFFALSPLILLFSSLKQYYILVILYYISFSINSNIGYFIRGIGKVAIYSFSGIVNTLVTVLLNILFLLELKSGVVGYLFSFIIANLIATLFMILAGGLYRYHISIKRLDMGLLKRMLAYSFPLIPNSASWWVSNSSDKYILTFFVGVAANGVYSIAYKIPTIITMVTGLFTTAWRLSAVEQFGSKESKTFYSNVFNMYISLTAVMTSFLMLVNKPLSHFLYSKDFYQAWRYVPALLIASVIHSYSDFFGTIYTSVFKTKILFYSTLAGAGTNIVLNLLLIPRMEALGAAIATLASYFVVFIIRLVDSQKIMKLEYDICNDILCVIVIFIQLVVATESFKFEFIISGICFCVLIFIRRKNIKDILKMVLKRENKSRIVENRKSSDIDYNQHLKAYSGYAIKNDVLTNSTSGGAAYILSKAVIHEGGVVYGVGYSQDYKSAHYYRVASCEGLSVLQGSKYITTRKIVKINGTDKSVYKCVEEDIKAGLKVLFFGLGCDIGALTAYCSKNSVTTQNLYTVDLICQGPTLSQVETSFVKYLEKKYKSPITYFSVRYKKDGWVPPYILAIFENGKRHLESWEGSEFHYAFGHYSRKSCCECKFKGLNHISDITIGDYWGISMDDSSYNRNGVSALLVRTSKGEKLISLIDSNEFFLRKADANHIIENNPMFDNCRNISSNNQEFGKNLKEKGLHFAVVKDMGVFKYYYLRIRKHI